MQFSKINNVAMHFQLIGAQNKPVLVFLNELGTDFRIWRDVIMQLVGEFSIVLYDMRGHGLSDEGDSDFSFQAHIDDLAALLDHLEVERALLCGTGFGSLLAQGLYHSERRALVQGLILCSPETRFVESRLHLSSYDRIQSWFGTAGGEPATLRGYEMMLNRMDDNAYARSLTGARGVDYDQALLQIGVPFIGVTGDLYKDEVMALCKKVVGAHYEHISGGGRMLPVDKPHELSDVIQAFSSTL